MHRRGTAQPQLVKVYYYCYDENYQFQKTISKIMMILQIKSAPKIQRDPQNEDEPNKKEDLKNEDDPRNEDNLKIDDKQKIEDILENQDNYKKEDNPKNENDSGLAFMLVMLPFTRSPRAQSWFMLLEILMFWVTKRGRK